MNIVKRKQNSEHAGNSKIEFVNNMLKIGLCVKNYHFEWPSDLTKETNEVQTI